MVRRRSLAKQIAMIVFVIGLSWTATETCIGAQGHHTPGANRKDALRVAFGLAADFRSGTDAQQSNLLEVIDERGTISDEELLFAHAAFKAPPDSRYEFIAVAEAAQPYAYIRALRASYGRFQYAEMVGDNDRAAKQFKTAQEYAALLANTLTLEAQRDEQDLRRLSQFSFAVRRSPADQARFLQNLKGTGLTPEHRKLLKESGRTDEEIEAFERRLFGLPPEELGVSPAEALAQIANRRRMLAAELKSFANANPASVAATRAQTFIVGNPHDREETVQLVIRPISIPPDWKLSIVNAEQMETAAKPGAAAAASKYPVQAAMEPL